MITRKGPNGGMLQKGIAVGYDVDGVQALYSALLIETQRSLAAWAQPA